MKDLQLGPITRGWRSAKECRPRVQARSLVIFLLLPPSKQCFQRSLYNIYTELYNYKRECSLNLYNQLGSETLRPEPSQLPPFLNWQHSVKEHGHAGRKGTDSFSSNALTLHTTTTQQQNISWKLLCEVQHTITYPCYRKLHLQWQWLLYQHGSCSETVAQCQCVHPQQRDVMESFLAATGNTATSENKASFIHQNLKSKTLSVFETLLQNWCVH